MSTNNNFIPFLPVRFNQNNQNEGLIKWQADKPVGKEQQYFPFGFKKLNEADIYYLPYEPMIDIQGGNTIIRRHIAKAPKTSVGTIKERWNQKDYEITIRGFLMGSILTGNVEDCYPIEDFNKLKEYMTAGESIKVYNPILEMLDIHELVVSDFSYPFTKGENVQAYEIKCYSNLPTEVLIDIIDD